MIDNVLVVIRVGLKGVLRGGIMTKKGRSEATSRTKVKVGQAKMKKSPAAKASTAAAKSAGASVSAKAAAKAF